MSLQESNGQSRDRGIPPSAVYFLQQLEAFCDPKVGLPITSHRNAPLGPILVIAKTAFRSLFQAFINEMLRKQSLFNENLLKLIHVLFHDIQSVEGSTLAMRAGLQERLRKLEDRLAALEAVPSEARLRTSEVDPTASAKGDKN